MVVGSEGWVSRLSTEPALFNQCFNVLYCLENAFASCRLWAGFWGRCPRTSAGALPIYSSGGRNPQTLCAHPTTRLRLRYWCGRVWRFRGGPGKGANEAVLIGRLYPYKKSLTGSYVLRGLDAFGNSAGSGSLEPTASYAPLRLVNQSKHICTSMYVVSELKAHYSVTQPSLGLMAARVMLCERKVMCNH